MLHCYVYWNSYSTQSVTAQVSLVPEQRYQLPSDKWTFFGELSSPGGIVVDEDGFVYVSDFVQTGKGVIL